MSKRRKGTEETEESADSTIPELLPELVQEIITQGTGDNNLYSRFLSTSKTLGKQALEAPEREIKRLFGAEGTKILENNLPEFAPGLAWHTFCVWLVGSIYKHKVKLNGLVGHFQQPRKYFESCGWLYAPVVVQMTHRDFILAAIKFDRTIPRHNVPREQNQIEFFLGIDRTVGDDDDYYSFQQAYLEEWSPEQLVDINNFVPQWVEPNNGFLFFTADQNGQWAAVNSALAYALAKSWIVWNPPNEDKSCYYISPGWIKDNSDSFLDGDERLDLGRSEPLRFVHSRKLAKFVLFWNWLLKLPDVQETVAKHILLHTVMHNEPMRRGSFVDPFQFFQKLQEYFVNLPTQVTQNQEVPDLDELVDTLCKVEFHTLSAPQITPQILWPYHQPDDDDED